MAGWILNKIKYLIFFNTGAQQAGGHSAATFTSIYYSVPLAGK